MNHGAMLRVLRFARKNRGEVPERLIVDMILAADELGDYAARFKAFPRVYRTLWFNSGGDARAVFAQMSHAASTFRGPLAGAMKDESLAKEEEKKRRNSIRSELRYRYEEMLIALSRRDGGLYCLHCGSDEDLVIDHVVPIAQGGTNDLVNLQMLCHDCNTQKGNRTMEQWVRRGGK